MTKPVDYTNLLTRSFKSNPCWFDLFDTINSVYTHQVGEPIEKLSRSRDSSLYRIGNTIRLGAGNCTVVKRRIIESTVWTELQPQNWAYSMWVMDLNLTSYLGYQASIGEILSLDATQNVLSIIKTVHCTGQYYAVIRVTSSGEYLYANLDNFQAGVLGSSYVVGGVVNTGLGLATIISIDYYSDTKKDEIYVDGFLEDFGTIRVEINTLTERSILVYQAEQLGFFLLSDSLTDEDYKRVVDFVSLYYPESGTKNFILFMGFVLNAVFTIAQMWSNTNPGDDYVLFSELSTGDVPIWESGGIWYPTSHVVISYDSLQFPSLSTTDVTTIFYLLAPIHLYLYRIDAKAYASVTFGLQAYDGPIQETLFSLT